MKGKLFQSFRMMPVTPTQAMKKAGAKEIPTTDAGGFQEMIIADRVWKAMREAWSEELAQDKDALSFLRDEIVNTGPSVMIHVPEAKPPVDDDLIAGFYETPKFGIIADAPKTESWWDRLTAGDDAYYGVMALSFLVVAIASGFVGYILKVITQ